MSMMGIIMRNDILLTIKDTLEDSQNIKVLSMNVEDNIVFGIYVNDIRDSLSFLGLPKNRFETIVDDIKICFFELGSVLHSIYFHGALDYIEKIVETHQIINPPSDYIELCELIVENIPFNIAKVKYIEAHIQYFDNGCGSESVSILMDVAKNLNDNLLLWYGKYMENFLYVEDIKTENDIIKACNSLNEFKKWLENENFTKISQKKMNDIDQKYINIQLLHH